MLTVQTRTNRNGSREAFIALKELHTGGLAASQQDIFAGGQVSKGKTAVIIRADKAACVALLTRSNGSGLHQHFGERLIGGVVDKDTADFVCFVLSKETAAYHSDQQACPKRPLHCPSPRVIKFNCKVVFAPGPSVIFWPENSRSASGFAYSKPEISVNA